MEEKPLTLSQAKDEIERRRDTALSRLCGSPKDRGLFSEGAAFGDALVLLSRVQEPSEDDRAALWLMKEKNYQLSFLLHKGWFRGLMRLESPAEEAKKLGWGGGE